MGVGVNARSVRRSNCSIVGEDFMANIDDGFPALKNTTLSRGPSKPDENGSAAAMPIMTDILGGSIEKEEMSLNSASAQAGLAGLIARFIGLVGRQQGAGLVDRIPHFRQI